jgi:hypothetical protein
MAILNIQRFGIVVPTKRRGARIQKKTFYQSAKRHIIKAKKGVPSDLSQRIDEILYGA